MNKRNRRLSTMVVLSGIVLLCAGLMPGIAAAQASTSVSPQAITYVRNIRAAHHVGFDRVVIDIQGPFPTTLTHGYVNQLAGCGSGEVIPVPGNAIYAVHMNPAQAHADNVSWVLPDRIAFEDTYAVYGTQGECDFEGYVDIGIVLGKNVGTPNVYRLTNPNRLVLDFPTSSLTVQTRKIYFVNNSGNVQAVTRPVIAPSVATSSLQRLFMGPTQYEQSQLGLQFVNSEATGFTNLRISDRIARVQLTGGCNSGGATVTVASEMMPTLRQFSTVDWVKIYDLQGQTEQPTGNSDSIPFCLEP